MSNCLLNLFSIHAWPDISKLTVGFWKGWSEEREGWPNDATLTAVKPIRFLPEWNVSESARRIQAAHTKVSHMTAAAFYRAAGTGHPHSEVSSFLVFAEIMIKVMIKKWLKIPCVVFRHTTAVKTKNIKKAYSLFNRLGKDTTYIKRRQLYCSRPSNSAM